MIEEKERGKEGRERKRGIRKKEATISK